MLDFRRTFWALGLGAVVVGMLVPTSVILAQIAVSANDNKVVLVNGMSTVVQNPAPDTVAIIDLKQFPTKIIAEIEVPARVVGPPLSVAITHETRWQQAGGYRSAPQDEGGPAAMRTAEKPLERNMPRPLWS